jgi:hypothetical protein
MPFTIDTEALKDVPGKPAIVSMDPMKPPVKPIPHMDYPRVVYKHPKEPFKVVIHRNALHEVVQEERVPSEHLSRVVASKEEFDRALQEGWVADPYIPKAAPDPNKHLYDAPAERKAK